MKYRKKPIVIEAYQTDVELDIETLEGIMHASIGDYIITGVNGEKYPCKPDIFEKTYELVEESNYETSKELKALESMCEFCHKQIMAQPSKGTLPHKMCPFRHISGDYCEEYDIIKKALEDIDYIKDLRENQKHNIEMLIEENRTMKKAFAAVAVIKKRFKISSSPFEPFLKQVTGMTDEEIDILKEGLGYYDKIRTKRD